MSRYDLTDFEWRVIEPLLPDKPRGMPWLDDRRVLNGIFWVAAFGRTMARPARALWSAHDLLQPLRAMATPATGRLVRRNWHYHFARAFNEELCGWTDGAVLQGHDPNGPGRDRQVHWQHLEAREIWAELQNRI